MSKSLSKGLSSAEAAARLKRNGKNIIFQAHRVSFLEIFWEEIREPMILLLLFVGVVYSFWGKLEDALTIFFVISTLVLAEVYNEYRAKHAIEALALIAAPLAKVIRDGQIAEIAAADIVVGDLLVLSDGVKLAADAKVIQGLDLQLDEAALTGESYPESKAIGSMALAGTIVSSGEGLAEVAACGANTRLGQIAKTAAVIKPPKTALQLAMKKLSLQLVYVAIFFSAAIPLIGWLRGEDLRLMVLTGLSLSFATIPEELPIVITMVLGLGAYKLSQKNFLIKRIKAAETLGTATVIVSDKTGTITSGKLTLKSAYPKAGSRLKRSAERATTAYSLKPLDKLIRQESGIADFDSDVVRQRSFSNEAKTNAVIRKDKGGKLTVYIKGSPEAIFAKCSSVSAQARAELRDQSAMGRRVIAVASRELLSNEASLPWKKIESKLILAGLLSFEDSARPGVKETVAQAAKAGIRTIMITGDNPDTAGYIAEKVGIFGAGRLYLGSELDRLDAKELQEAVKGASVFARTTPEHKYRIVQALQANGEVVAVTGDGINDALALKGADIGIAMGLRGTDVAKEAAEVVLADDNFNTIAHGIFEGRKFYDNLSKGIKYYLAVKAALIMIFLLPVLIGIPLPFSPIQIILMELFMDLAASAGFVSESAELDIFTRKPRLSSDPVIDWRAFRDIMAKGLMLFLTVTGVYLFARSIGWTQIESQTAAFSAWIFCHIAVAYVSRSDDEPLWKLGWLSNFAINLWAVAAVFALCLLIYVPGIGADLGLAAIKPQYLLLAAVAAVTLPLLFELKKTVFGQIR